MRRIHILAALLLAACLAGCDDRPANGQTPERTATAAPAPVAQDLDWDSLIPTDWQPDALLGQYDASSLEDDDPRAKELMEKLKRLWAEAPVVPKLDGKLVRLPGFVVPLEADASKIAEFLMVPYYGACIHVPPPPANQTVYVRLPPELAFEGQTFDTVWVTGILRVTPTNSELADAGYRIEATGIAPYDKSVEPL